MDKWLGARHGHCWPEEFREQLLAQCRAAMFSVDPPAAQCFHCSVDGMWRIDSGSVGPRCPRETCKQRLGLRCSTCFTESTLCDLWSKISTWWKRKCSRSLSFAVGTVYLRKWYCTFAVYIDCNGPARRHSHGTDPWAFCCMPAEQWCSHFRSGARRWRPGELIAVVGGAALWWGAGYEAVLFSFVLIMFMFVCVRHMTAFMSCDALGLCFRQGNNYLYTVSGFVAHVSGDHFVAYVRSQNQWLLCNDATVSVVSVLGPVGPCPIVLERLRWQQFARPARQASCGQRLPLSLAAVVAGNCRACGWCSCGACGGSATWLCVCEDCWLAPWTFCGGTATQASWRHSRSRKSAWMGMLCWSFHGIENDWNCEFKFLLTASFNN